MGFFYRTIRIVENGIKPAYVFDGKPPELKSGVVRLLLLQPKDGLSDHCDIFSCRNVLKSVRKQRRRVKRLKRLVFTPMLCSSE